MLKLNAAGDGSLSVTDSVTRYIRDNSVLNRLRDIVTGNDGITLYVITDIVGIASGPAGGGGTVTDGFQYWNINAPALYWLLEPILRIQRKAGLILKYILIPQRQNCLWTVKEILQSPYATSCLMCQEDR
jgi:hypothetical protein